VAAPSLHALTAMAGLLGAGCSGAGSGGGGDSYDTRTTHVVVALRGGALPRTQKTLCALAAGTPLLSADWVSACAAADDVVDEAPYECRHLCSTPDARLLPRALGGRCFEHMRAAVCCDTAQRSAAMGRILRLGGATVIEGTAAAAAALIWAAAVVTEDASTRQHVKQGPAGEPPPPLTHVILDPPAATVVAGSTPCCVQVMGQLQRLQALLLRDARRRR
jgi:hypothetical protein